MKKSQTQHVQTFLDVLNNGNEQLEKRMKILEVLYETANLGDKKSIWAIPFGETIKREKKDALLEFLEKEPAFKENEILFYNDYINSIKKTSGKYLATEWFINKTSNKWLLRETEFITFIIKNFIGHISITSSYVKVKKALINKLETLSKEQYEEFLEKNITHAHYETKNNYITFIMGYGSPEKVKHIYELYKEGLSKSVTAVMGIALILRKDMNLIKEYQGLVLDGLNKSISSTSYTNKIGVVLNTELLQLIFDNYDDFKNEGKEKFISEIINKAVAFYKAQHAKLQHGDKDIFDIIFDVSKKTPEKLPENTILFLLHRVLLNFSKKEKDYFVDRLLEHSKEVGLYENIRKVMLVGNNEEVYFNRKKMDMHNAMIRGYFKNFLYQDLMEDLEYKPSSKKLKL